MQTNYGTYSTNEISLSERLAINNFLRFEAETEESYSQKLDSMSLVKFKEYAGKFGVNASFRPALAKDNLLNQYCKAKFAYDAIIKRISQNKGNL